MLKYSVGLSITFLAMFSTILLPPIVNAWYGEYTIQPMSGGAGVFASRCDHLVDPPASDDAWTGCGIAAYYAEAYPPHYQYDNATYFFQRGYGYGNQYSYHDWTTTYSMPLICNYQYDQTYFRHDEYGYPQWHAYEYPLYNWSAWYQNWSITPQTFPLSLTVGCNTVSNFVDVEDPDHVTYVCSVISWRDMYAQYPNWREE